MRRRDPIVRMLETRRLYKMEETLYGHRPFNAITRQLTIRTLKHLAKQIWMEERPSYKMPTIRFGKGTMHVGRYYSWCDGDTIELAPTQQDKLTLIHELVHAMGYDDHDERFARRYKQLLKKYAPVEEKLIDEEFQKLHKEM